MIPKPMTTRFHVLIHAPLYEAVQRLPASARGRFRRVVASLAAGRWEGGARVRKLRGVGKPVFEARQDDGERILFTVVHSASRVGSPIPRPHLQLWDLVRHDEVSGRAARINPSAEAEFLDFSETESEIITEVPPHPAASFAEVPESAPGHEAGVVEFVCHTGPAAIEPREEIAGGVRWYVLPDGLLVDESAWQDLMDRGLAELELKLTAEQYAVVRAPGPVLLSGSAGSGKTTIAVHRLAAACAGSGTARVLYVTYSKWLLDLAQRLYADLLACRGHAARSVPEFLTMDDLYRTVLASARQAPPERVASFAEFRRWVAAAFRGEDAALAWEEIRSIVKGANLDTARALLPRGEYEALGRKRAPLFASARGRIYGVARRWQEHLDATGRADEIDLCRMALRSVPRTRGYDHVICDEAQDLAEIQVEFLLRLLAADSFAGLFMAGDPQQVINPSGFRWAEVRSRIRDRFLGRGRPVPDLLSLTRNFRSVRGLVELANEVLAWKRERTGRSDGDEAEESHVAGPAPILVTDGEERLAEAVRGFGPRCAVIAGSDEIRDRLQRDLETTRVFTVPESKGLEFDVAVLWGLLAADPAPWKRLLNPSLDLREDPSSRRALHHLYVAVTRARRHLAILEPPGCPKVFSLERFASKLDSEVAASLSRLFVRAASPAEWLREAEYFRDRARFRQAAECYRRAGEARLEIESLALHHEAAGEHVAAATRWIELGDAARAARLLEKADDPAAAARQWRLAGEVERAHRCDCLAAESEKRWKEAAEGWEALDAWADAARCWSNAGQRPRQVRCLALVSTAEGRFADAAVLLEDVADWEGASEAWRRAGNPSRASAADARLHEIGRRWDLAAEAWSAAGDDGSALRCRAEGASASGRWDEAARFFERLGRIDEALRAWKLAGRPGEIRRVVARRDLAEGRFLRAAVAFEEMSEFELAADAWSKASDSGQQPSAPRPLPLPEAAAKAWARGEKPAKLLQPEPERRRRSYWHARLTRRHAERAVIHDSKTRELACRVRAAEDEADFGRAATIWKALGDPGQELRCLVTDLERAGRTAELASLLERKGRLERAADAWRRARRPDGAMRCQALLAEKKRDFEAAARLWEKLGETRRAAHVRAISEFQRQEYERAAAYFDAAGEPLEAVTARVLAAKERMDYDAAVRALEQANATHLLKRLVGRREAWLEEARWMAEARKRRLAAAARRAKPKPPSQRPLFENAGDMARQEGRRIEGTAPAAPGAAATARPKNRIRSIVDAVRDRPGSTCEHIALLAGLDTRVVKPIARELAATGILRKVGRTRGTRYYLAADRQ